MDCFHRRLWIALSIMGLALIINAWVLIANHEEIGGIVWSERCPNGPTRLAQGR